MKKSLLLVFLLSAYYGFSQSVDYKSAPLKAGSNYFEITKQVRAEITTAKKSTTKKSAFDKKLEVKKEKQFERWAYFWRDRVSSEGTFPNPLLGWYNAGIIDQNGKATQSNKKSITGKSASLQTWTNIGPSNYPEKNGYPNYPQLGRLTNFLRYVHPTDSNQNVLFVTAPVGGVWKSTDNGATWAPKLDYIAGIGVTDIKSSATDISNPGTIYIATGDYDGAHIGSLGVYKSTDFGETYQPTALTFGLTDTEVLSNLIVIDASTVIVGTKEYIKKTTDGGATWTNVFVVSGYNDSTFGKFHRNGSNIMCSSSWGGIYYSKDSGDTWGTVTENTGAADTRSAITADTATGLFWLQGKTGQVSTCDLSAPTPVLTNVGVPTTTYAAQEGYNQSLVVKDGLIISGSLNGMASNDNGATWRKAINADWTGTSDFGTYGHADVHELGPLDAGYSFYSVNDGGLDFVTFPTIGEAKPTVEYKSNGVVITQMYSVAISPVSEDRIITGNQDNDGYSKEMFNGNLTWVSAAAGDGTCTAIDYLATGTDATRYLGSQNGGLRRADYGFSGDVWGTSVVIGGEGVAVGAPFVWTLKMHTTNPAILYGGFADIQKSIDKGSTWTNLNSGAGQIKYIENYNGNLFVIGENSAKKSTNDGATWTSLVQPQAGTSMNSISIDQTNPLIVYATVRSYVAGAKVFKSTDGGSTWANISAGLPNVLMKQVVLKQNQTGNEILFAATEIGAYTKVGTADWAKLGSGLPNVIINDMEINYGVDKLIVATHGRGLWQISIDNNTLGIKETKLADTEVPVLFPNPVTNGILNIKLPDASKTFDYVVYNIVGGQVAHGKIDAKNTTIQLSNIANGVYMIKMNNGDKVSTQKFVVKN